MASTPNLDSTKKGLAALLALFPTALCFIVQCACVSMLRGRGKLRARREVGQ